MSKKLFVRESSGLIKEVGLIDSIMLTMTNISAGAALAASISPYIIKGALLWLGAILGMLFTIPQAYVYMRLVRIGRTGSDYIWISRNLSAPIGVTVNMAWILEAGAAFALFAYFFSSTVASVLNTIGTIDRVPSLVSISNIISTPAWSYAIGAILFTVIIIINIFRVKWGYRLITISSLLAVIITFIAIGVVAVHISDFSTAITPFLQKMNITPSPSYTSSTPPFNWVATIKMLPLFGLIAFIWINATAAVAGEIKKSKYAEWGVLIPLLLSGLIVALGFGVLYVAGGYNLTTYEFMNNGFVYTFWNVAIALSTNYILQWIIGIGSLLWDFAVLAYGAVIFARYVFAVAFDRILPEIFTVVRNGSPVYIHIFDLALTLSLLVVPFVSISGALALYGITVIGLVFFVFVGATGIRVGFKSKDVKLLLASIFTTAYFIFLTYEAVTNPVFSFALPNGAPNPITLGYVIGAFIAGAITYYAAKIIRLRKDGIDIDLIFKEIPPE